jgi:hypothetical protein
MKSISMALLALGLFASSAVRAADPLPRGWMLGGKGYEAGLDRQTKHGGSASAFLRRNGAGDEFGTLMQMIDATAYRGVRLRLTGYSRAVEVTGWAGFWLRVDGPAGVLAYDNMQSRRSRSGCCSLEAARSGPTTCDWRRSVRTSPSRHPDKLAEDQGRRKEPCCVVQWLWACSRRR